MQMHYLVKVNILGAEEIRIFDIDGLNIGKFPSNK